MGFEKTPYIASRTPSVTESQNADELRVHCGVCCARNEDSSLIWGSRWIFSGAIPGFWVVLTAMWTSLPGILGHKDREQPFRHYCAGLLLPGGRKSVEPMAARLAPGTVSAEHQSLLHFVGQSRWSSVVPALTARGPVEGWRASTAASWANRTIARWRSACRWPRPRRACLWPGGFICRRGGPRTRPPKPQPALRRGRRPRLAATPDRSRRRHSLRGPLRHLPRKARNHPLHPLVHGLTAPRAIATPHPCPPAPPCFRLPSLLCRECWAPSVPRTRR